LKKQTRAYIFAAGAVLLWSTVATAFKIALQSAGFIQLLFYASLTAFVFLGMVLIAGKQTAEFKKLNKRDIILAAFRGLLNPFLYYLILFKAYSVLPAQEAMSLNYIWPIVLVLLSAPVLKQKISVKGFAGIIISFAGVVVIAFRGDFSTLHFDNPAGTALAIFSSVVWAVFWLANLKSKISETLKLFLSFGFGVIFTIPVVMVFSSFAIDGAKTAAALVYVGIAEMGLSFYLWLRALSLSERTDKVSRLIYLSPFLSLFFIAVFLGEPIGISTIAGLLLIITGIVLKDKK
jgi:drug/metabolite transporter (DMT)-like permease